MWDSKLGEVARELDFRDMLRLSPKSIKRHLIFFFFKPLYFGSNPQSSLLIWPWGCLIWFIFTGRCRTYFVVQVSGIRRKLFTAESCTLTISSGDAEPRLPILPMVCFWLYLDLYQHLWSIINVTRGRPVNYNNTLGKLAPTYFPFQVHQIWHLCLELPSHR